VSSLSRGLINDTPTLDDQTLFVRPVKIGRQLTIEISIEDIRTKKQVKATALIDSGCMRTCIDGEFTRKNGLVLQWIANPIKVEYVDGTSVEDSTIRYSTDIRIRAAGATVVTGALVTRLKSAKVFLGFDWLQSVNPRINWKEFCVEAEEDAEVLKMQSTKIVPENPDTERKRSCVKAKGSNEAPRTRLTNTIPKLSNAETKFHVEANKDTEAFGMRSTETPTKPSKLESCIEAKEDIEVSNVRSTRIIRKEPCVEAKENIEVLHTRSTKTTPKYSGRSFLKTDSRTYLCAGNGII
jgi:hypothetical protein